MSSGRGASLARVRHGGAEWWAVAGGGGALRLLERAGTTRDFLAGGGAARAAEAARGAGPAGAATVQLDDPAVELLSPVTQDAVPYATGANYKAHVEDMDPALVAGMRETRTIGIFAKLPGSLTSARGPILRPPFINLLDYEVEFAVVLKKVDRPVVVTPDNLHQYIHGLVACNDVSARDVQLQLGGMNIVKGKSYRTFLPCGPFIRLLTVDEMRYVADLDLELKVNGKTRQRAHSSQLLWNVPECLTDLFQVTPTQDGDIYLTGTPGGTAAKAPKVVLAQRLTKMAVDDVTLMKVIDTGMRKNPDFLHDGDVVEVSIRSGDGVVDLGTQRNVVRNADPADYPGKGPGVVSHWRGARVGRLVFGWYLVSVIAAFAAGRWGARPAAASVAAYAAAVLLTAPRPAAKL